MSTENTNLIAEPGEAAIAPPATLLQTVQAQMTDATRVFLEAAGAELERLREHYKGVVWEADIGTTQGMNAAVRARAAFRQLRTRILKPGSDALKEPGKAVAALLNDTIKDMSAVAQAEEDKIDAYIKAEEKRKTEARAEAERLERERVAGLRAKITLMTGLPVKMVGLDSAAIFEQHDELMARDLGDMQELTEEAESVRRSVAATLSTMASERADIEERAEAQRQEQERMAAERAELERQQAEIRAQQARVQQANEAVAAINGLPARLIEKNTLSSAELTEESMLLAAATYTHLGDLAVLAEAARANTLATLDQMIAAAKEDEAEALAIQQEQDTGDLSEDPASHADVIGAIQEDIAATVATTAAPLDEAEEEGELLVLDDDNSLVPAGELPAVVVDEPAQEEAGQPEDEEPEETRPTNAQLRFVIAEQYGVDVEVAHQWLMGYADTYTAELFTQDAPEATA